MTCLLACLHRLCFEFSALCSSSKRISFSPSVLVLGPKYGNTVLVLSFFFLKFCSYCIYLPFSVFFLVYYSAHAVSPYVVLQLLILADGPFEFPQLIDRLNWWFWFCKLFTYLLTQASEAHFFQFIPINYSFFLSFFCSITRVSIFLLQKVPTSSRKGGLPTVFDQSGAKHSTLKKAPAQVTVPGTLCTAGKRTEHTARM
ncbi:hypothetical protein F5884DRAFT_791466 [Xylogone sp. PMI_703]|nr:hypothetical protein F5884DRAFT_791466 [Xylogone sp. PMI_703]